MTFCSLCYHTGLCNTHINLKISTFSNFKIHDIEVRLDWALLVALNRGKMESVKNSQIYHRFVNMSKDGDMMIGYIADDRMFVVPDRFFDGEIMKEQELSEADWGRLKEISECNRSAGIAIAEDNCRKSRREGRYFDEILKAGE